MTLVAGPPITPVGVARTQFPVAIFPPELSIAKLNPEPLKRDVGKLRVVSPVKFMISPPFT
jgi:hypothetical protein